MLDANNGKRLKTLGEKALGGFGGPVPGLIAWAPDGTWLAVAGGLPGGFAPDNEIRVFDARAGELARHFDLGAPPVALAIGPRGQRLAAASFAGPGGTLGNPFIRIWARNGSQAPVQIKLEPMRTGNNHPGQLIAFDPNGRSLAAGGTALTLWDADSGERKRIIYRGPTRVGSLAWDADGTLLAATTNARSIRVWRTTDWQPAALLTWKLSSENTDPDGAQARLAFTPDERLASAAPATGKLRLWEIGERQLMSAQLPTRTGLSATWPRFVSSLTWHGERFIVTGGTKAAVVARQLQYDGPAQTADTHDWQVARSWKTAASNNPDVLEAWLPEALPKGIHRSGVNSKLNSNGKPKTTATYDTPDGSFKLSIEQASAEHIQAYSQRMGAMVAQAPGVSATEYKNHTLYAGPKPGGGYMLMLFLDRFVIQIAGDISAEKARTVLEAMDLDALSAAGTATSTLPAPATIGVYLADDSYPDRATRFTPSG